MFSPGDVLTEFSSVLRTAENDMTHDRWLAVGTVGVLTERNSAENSPLPHLPWAGLAALSTGPGAFHAVNNAQLSQPSRSVAVPSGGWPDDVMPRTARADIMSERYSLHVLIL